MTKILALINNKTELYKNLTSKISYSIFLVYKHYLKTNKKDKSLFTELNLLIKKLNSN